MSPSGRTPLVWRTYLPLKEEKKRGWRKKVDGDDGWKLHPKLNEWLTDEIFVWPIAQNSGRCNHEYQLSPGFLGVILSASLAIDRVTDRRSGGTSLVSI